MSSSQRGSRPSPPAGCRRCWCGRRRCPTARRTRSSRRSLPSPCRPRRSSSRWLASRRDRDRTRAVGIAFALAARARHHVDRALRPGERHRRALGVRVVQFVHDGGALLPLGMAVGARVAGHRARAPGARVTVVALHTATERARAGDHDRGSALRRHRRGQRSQLPRHASPTTERGSGATRARDLARHLSRHDRERARLHLGVRPGGPRHLPQRSRAPGSSDRHPPR